MFALVLGLMFAYVWLKGDHTQRIDHQKVVDATKKERRDLVPNTVLFKSTHDGIFVNNDPYKRSTLYRSHDVVGETNPFIDVKRMHGYRPPNLNS